MASGYHGSPATEIDSLATWARRLPVPPVFNNLSELFTALTALAFGRRAAKLARREGQIVTSE
jgi:hypothetical protein